MASKKDKDDNESSKKRTIEFDWFVRDLEPDDNEKIRGGGKRTDQQKSDDHSREQN